LLWPAREWGAENAPTISAASALISRASSGCKPATKLDNAQGAADLGSRLKPYSGEHGIDSVSGTVSEVVASYAVLGLGTPKRSPRRRGRRERPVPKGLTVGRYFCATLLVKLSFWNFQLILEHHCRLRSGM
jgi:hypothetical protein